MNPKKMAARIRERMSLGMVDAVVKGDGYEALVLRQGIVMGRVYLGTLAEVEGGAAQGEA